MDVLVTGDTGFIGSFLVERLKKEGHTVSGLNTKNGDIRDIMCVKKCVKGKDLVFHLACISNPLKANEKMEESYNVIYRGSENVSNACKQYNAKLVYISSRSVYGDGMIPTPEETPLHPIGWYGTYKMLGEHLCSDNDIVFRLSNVYGCSNKCHSIVTRFIQFIKAKKSIPIFNNFDVTRDFVYIDDLIDALMLGVANTGVYNVGSGVEISLKELLDVISETLDIEYTTIDMKRGLEGEVQRVCLNIDKIEREFGWKPKISLEEGVKRCKNV